MKIVVTARNFDLPGCRALQMLRDAGHEVIDYGHMGLGAGAPQEQLLPLVAEADAVICGLEPYRESLLKQMSSLKVLSRRGIGYDSVDVAACRELGISVWRTAGAVEGSVAEHVLACILHHARRIDLQDQPMHEHRWQRMLTPGAKGRTLGLIGFGGIGKEIARRAVPFGMKVLYTCRHPQKEWEAMYGVTYSPMEELLAASDYVSLNVPLTEETRGMIGKAQLAMMKPDACLINIARSPVMDVDALANALHDGQIAAAYVDVYPQEPCTDSPLMDCPTAVLTPHTASYTQENFTAMNELSALNVLRFLCNEPDGGCRLV